MVSIVILSYNTKDLLLECLSSLKKNLKKNTYEVIVVDNASTDDSVQALKKIKSTTPQFTLIENEKNGGFTKGCNQGAQKAKGTYIVFLNSDTRITDDSIHDMALYMEKNSQVGVLGGMLKNSDGTMQRSYGSFYTLGSLCLFLFGGDRGELLLQKHTSEADVDWVSGGFMMVRKEVFDKVKGFDEHIFMYIEDMELCFRIKKAGFGVYVYPHAQVIHVGQGSSNRAFAIVHIYQGLLYFYKKHKSNFEYIIVKGMLRIKAYCAWSIGIMTNNAYLKKTYAQLLSV